MKRVFAAGLAMGLVMALAAGTCFGQKSAAKAGACERLARLSLPDAKITLAQRLAAGTFTPMTPGHSVDGDGCVALQGAACVLPGGYRGPA